MVGRIEFRFIYKGIRNFYTVLFILSAGGDDSQWSRISLVAYDTGWLQQHPFANIPYYDGESLF